MAICDYQIFKCAQCSQRLSSSSSTG
uniref:Uncharacterized protein n=1 Tax=Arundo donax TaxID=35708 RepID=A0A0A9SS55_ARUDO